MFEASGHDWPLGARAPLVRSGLWLGPTAAAMPSWGTRKAPGGSAAGGEPGPAEFAPGPDLRTIRFDFDKADLGPGAADILATDAREP
jgi:hypothetical protein